VGFFLFAAMSESEQQTEDICWKVYPNPTDVRKRDDLGKCLALLCVIARNELLIDMQRDMDTAVKH
jgi:hypothetical protein